MSVPSKGGILEILELHSDDELFSLAGTVTQGLLRNKLHSREEAIQAIINYSSDEISILRRKMITRETLFDYLHTKKVPVTLPVSKNELIDIIVTYWTQLEGQNLSQCGQETKVESTQCYDVNIFNRIPSLNNVIKDDQVVPKNSEENENVYLMAQQFTSWFYSMMNENSPISAEHFYPDAVLRLNICSGGTSNTEVVESNPPEICSSLFRTKMEHNLFFNPNISKEGVQGRMDPHGLVMVGACGTLHVNDVCVGVFEQIFALARDPFADNNWKIKNTQLNLKSQQGVISPPSLCDNELTSTYLSLHNS